MLCMNFACECDARYVGRTSQRLVDRMRQQIPLTIRKGTDRCNGCCQPKLKCKANQPKPESDSAIGTHLLNSVECGNSGNEDCLGILSKERSAFHLKILEAVFINHRDPSLCRQKEFVLALQLFCNWRRKFWRLLIGWLLFEIKPISGSGV